MRTDDYLISVAVKRCNEIVRARIEKVVLLPRRGDKNLLIWFGGFSSLFVRFVTHFFEIVRKGEAELDESFLRKPVNLFRFADFLFDMLAGAEDRVEIIERALFETVKRTHGVVREINVFDIFFDERTFEIIRVEVWRSHYEHIRFDEHH